MDDRSIIGSGDITMDNFNMGMMGAGGGGSNPSSNTSKKAVHVKVRFLISTVHVEYNNYRENRL